MCDMVFMYIDIVPNRTSPPAEDAGPRDRHDPEHHRQSHEQYATIVDPHLSSSFGGLSFRPP